MQLVIVVLVCFSCNCFENFVLYKLVIKVKFANDAFIQSSRVETVCVFCSSVALGKTETS